MRAPVVIATLTLAWLSARFAHAVQDCKVGDKPINLNNGHETHTLTGRVICRDRDTGEVRRVGPPSTSASAAPPPATPFCVTKAFTSSPLPASSSGDACVVPFCVPFGSACSHAPPVRLVFVTVQPVTSPSRLSSRVISVPSADTAV